MSAAKHTPAFQAGERDFRNGAKTNPYSVPRWRREWDAGHEHARAKAATGGAA